MRCKKIIGYGIVFILVFSLTSCSFNLKFLNKKKPNNFYYTNLMAKNFTLENSVKVVLCDTNFYTEKELSKNDSEIIYKLIKSLKKSNFISAPNNLPSKPLYKFFLTFSKEKFVINVYNERYISIHPWDGTFPMDYIDMNDIYNSYNIYYLSQYLIPR